MEPEEIEGAETGEPAPEPSGENELAELRAEVRELIEGVAELRNMLAGAVDAINSVAVDNGAQFTDADETDKADDNGAIEVTEEIQDPRKRDYTI